MVYRTNNPLEFFEVDGIVIDERAPAPQIKGVGANTSILVGQFQRGPEGVLKSISSTANFYELYNKSAYSGNKQLANKRFPGGKLKIIRVVASDAALATKTFDDGGTPVDIIKFDAKYKGVYGNKIKVTIEDGTTTGKKYTIEDTNDDTEFTTEVYDNIVITAIDSTTFSASKLVDVTVLATSAEPDDAAGVVLASGSDGTIADTDYEAAIAVAEQLGAGNVVWLDDYNATRNGYLKVHAGLTKDKMVICAGAEDETVAQAVTAVANLRDTDGRIIYAFNWVETTIDGVKEYTSPASWYASILAQTSPHIDPANSENTQFLFGASALKQGLTRADYIELMENGISAFENDPDIGFKIRSGIVTQIADSSKLTVIRRRMADYLTSSAGAFLKLYQNKTNSSENRTSVGGAILNFVKGREDLGILPKDSEVEGGAAKLVDVDSLNTDLSIGEGKFFILWKQRIYSSMRFIVLQAEIGETVVVEEV